MSCPGSVQELFATASDIGQRERAAFLNKHCGENAALLRQVESLLTAADQADGYFSELADRLGLPSLLSEEAELPQTDEIGPYRLVRLLGRGGMGAVYLADRADRQFQKRVAVKILPPGVGREALRDRFLVERQILARLEHPNIARLLDGGVTDDGIPYFVMDYVRGTPIDRYCDEERLGVDRRLQLFCQVCAAVEYAHRNLVVHRDLKPGNVLVDDAGAVKLLDFGIAKILDPTAGTAELTRASVQPMTPLYASPEMIKGEPVTTATDVYALGILLYELLTGCRPYRVEHGTEAEISRLVCEQEPRPASKATLGAGYDEAEVARTLAMQRGVSAERLRTQLRGDLDIVVATALRKDPELRYGSVAELAADIQRHRARLPIAARPPNIGYRIRKFVSRHTALVAVGALAAVLLVVTGVLAGSYLVTTARQAQAIALERDKAQQTQDFLLSIFNTSDPNVGKGESVTAMELLDRGAVRIDRELAGRPLLQAALKTTIAEVYEALALYDRARPLFVHASELYREAAGELSPEHASSLENLSQLVEITGDYDEAESLALSALRARKEIGQTLGIADASLRLGRVVHLKGDYTRAEEQFRNALEIYRARHGEDHPKTAESLSHLGTLMEHRGHPEVAEGLHRRALSTRLRLNGYEHLDVVESLHNLASAVASQEKYAEAKRLYEEALALNTKLLSREHRDNAFMHNGLAKAHQGLGEYALAEREFRTAIRILERHFGARHGNVGLGKAYLGRLLLTAGHTAAAEPVLEEALTILDETLPEHWIRHEVERALGICMLESGRYEQAERLLLEAWRGLSDKRGADHENAQLAARNLIRLFQSSGRPERADSLLHTGQ